MRTRVQFCFLISPALPATTLTYGLRKEGKRRRGGEANQPPKSAEDDRSMVGSTNTIVTRREGQGIIAVIKGKPGYPFGREAPGKPKPHPGSLLTKDREKDGIGVLQTGHVAREEQAKRSKAENKESRQGGKSGKKEGTRSRLSRTDFSSRERSSETEMVVRDRSSEDTPEVWRRRS